MKKSLLISVILIFVFQTTISSQIPAWQSVSPSRVLVVYNTSSGDANNNGKPDSQDLAEYYQSKRNIPASNMLNIAATGYFYMVGYDAKMTNWRMMWDEMLTPIKNKLTTLGDTTILYILLCDPMPYFFYLPTDTSIVPSTSNNGRCIDNCIATINDIGTRNKPKAFPYYWANNAFFDTYPGVDGSGDVGQFNHNYKSTGTNMYLVSRLMSSNLPMMINQVDMALYGDKYIFSGNGYYNGICYTDNQGGAYDSLAMIGYPKNANNSTDWDKDIFYVQKFYEQAGLPYKSETSMDVIGDATAKWLDGSNADHADSALLYTGWYNFSKYNDVWKWIPGSVACDLNSNSSQYVREGGAFIGGSFKRGLTAGAGVVSEPYLQGHPRGDIMLYYMLGRHNFIEAASHGIPGLKWESILIGDPLYNPFNKSKTPVKDLGIEPSITSYKFIDLTSTDVKLDYSPTEAAPEVVMATLYYGTTTGVYTDTIHSDSLYFAHHTFRFRNISKDSTYYYKICVKDPVNNTWCSSENSFKTDGTTVTGVADQSKLVTDVKIFPNPAQNSFYVRYELKDNSVLEIKLTNMLGEVVYNETKFEWQGSHTKEIQLTNLPAGIYNVQLKAGETILSKTVSKFY